MVCSAQLACRSPPRLSRCRLVLPEEAGIGVVPHRAAKVAGLVIRSGLSPAVINSWAAESGPTPTSVSSWGAWDWTRVVMSSVASVISVVRCLMRRASRRRASLVARVGLVMSLLRSAAQAVICWVRVSGCSWSRSCRGR